MKRGERHQLGAVIEEVRAWVNTAQEARQLAAHMPISGIIALSPDNDELLITVGRVAAAGVLDEAWRFTTTAWLDGRKKSMQPAHEAADLVAALHRDFKASASDRRLLALRAGLAVHAGTEREDLRRILTDMASSRSQAWQMRHNAAHLPMTRTRFGPLTGEEATAARSMIQFIDAHHKKSALLLGPSACGTASCAEAHASARALAEFHAQARQAGLFNLIEQAATRVSVRLSSELDRLPGILADLDRWRLAARQVFANAEHLPLTRTGTLSEREAAVSGELAGIDDASIQAARAFHPSLCQTGACAGLHQPVAVLCAYQAKAAACGDGELIEQAADRVAAQMQDEREQLTAVLDDLDAWRAASLQAQHDAGHMPLTRSGVLTDSERAAMRMIDSSLTLHRAQASALLDATDCVAGTCHEHHRSGAVLARFHAESLRSGAGVEVVGAAQRVSAQSLQERDQVAELHKKVTTWPNRVAAIYWSRTDAARFLESRAGQLVASSVAVRISRVPMRLLPLQNQDCLFVARLALLQHKPLLEADKFFLTETEATAKLVLSAVSTGFTRLWQCRSDGKCEHAHSLLPVVYGQADAIEAELDRLGVDMADMPRDLDLLVEPSLGFTDWLPGDLGNPEWLEAAVTVRTRGNLAAILNAASTARQAAEKAHTAAGNVRAEDVINALKAMDLDGLRKASPRDKFRVAPLDAYGVRNVWDVLQFQEKYDLASVPGLGESSAKAITQAALRLREAVRDDTPVRIDVKRKSEGTATLLEALRRWDVTRKFKPTEEELALAQALTTLFRNNGKVDRVLAVTEGPVGEPPRLLNDLVISALDRVASPPVGDVDIWQDFLSRPADYFGMLTELGFTTEDEKKMHGDLPEEIIEAVRAKELKPGFFTASLRTYQNFGARFALTQEKVVIGDEMGLGKTVEALAVLAHLRANGQSHFLVVCPAAVVSNWYSRDGKAYQVERNEAPRATRGKEVRRQLLDSQRRRCRHHLRPAALGSGTHPKGRGRVCRLRRSALHQEPRRQEVPRSCRNHGLAEVRNAHDRDTDGEQRPGVQEPHRVYPIGPRRVRS